MLDWDDLRFFLAIARHRTLGAAAIHLRVTQSTVSRRLASLQEKMGVRLLQRAADGYVLTLAGESIRAHDILARWGGEEFVVLLPQTDLEGAEAVAERCRRSRVSRADW